MSFDTYYINMETSHHRRKDLISELQKTNLSFERFPGINGNMLTKSVLETTYKQHLIMDWALHLCTKKTIGCGLSHLMLYQYIHDKKDKSPYALILEDDVYVTEPEKDYTKEIDNLIESYTIMYPDWEIIRLHSFFWGLGSNAAYIIRTTHMDKFLNMKLFYHIDVQQNLEFKIYSTNKYFNTLDYKKEYGGWYDIYFDNQKLGFYLYNHAFPFMSHIVYFYHLFYVSLFLLIYIIINYLKTKYQRLFSRRHRRSESEYLL